MYDYIELECLLMTCLGGGLRSPSALCWR